MRYSGSFYDRQGIIVSVEIVTHKDTATTVEIGSDDGDGFDGGSGMWFQAEDAVEIASMAGDTTDVLLGNEATIRLLVRDFVEDLFCSSATDAVVEVRRGDECLFYGFVKPQTYSQPYNEIVDALELNCVDIVGALELCKYKQIGGAGVNYDSVRSGASQRTMLSVLTEQIGYLCGGVPDILYDGSKTLVGGGSVFSGVTISELVFLGDAEDDVKNCAEVVEGILKYYNLHLLQVGRVFYVFDWASVKNGADWSALSGVAPDVSPESVEMTFSNDNAFGLDTKISIGETYNRVKLTCTAEAMEDVVESPFEDDSLTSRFGNKQLYMSEIISEGEGQSAYNAFHDMIDSGTSTYDGASAVDWYLQVLWSKNWQTNGANSGNVFIQDNLSAYYPNDEFSSGDPVSQCWLPLEMGTKVDAAFFRVGKVERKHGNKDNSVQGSIDTKDWLVMSVNGSGEDNEASADALASKLHASIPMVEFKGQSSGGNFTPSDNDTTNYIVISGKMVLNPLIKETDNYNVLKAGGHWEYTPAGPNQSAPTSWFGNVVPSRNNNDGRYYTRMFFNSLHWNDTPVLRTDQDTTGWQPFTDTDDRQYQFKYSGDWNDSDEISKVSVLQCMLVIGDKCVVETSADPKSPSRFAWREYKTLEQLNGDEDAYYQQSFSIGIDPKIDDYLIGQEYDIQNNISNAMNIDEKGTAIPIKKSDGVNGQVMFKILGPVNDTIWNNVTRRHPTFFRHTKWEDNMVLLMNHVSSVMLSDFGVKLYSDNANVNNGVHGDIVYLSDTAESFVNEKDVESMLFTSALTSTERGKMGVSDAPCLSTPVEVSTGAGLVSIVDTASGLEGKPEQHYVSAVYEEFHSPKVLLDHSVEDSSVVSPWAKYHHPALSGRDFYAYGIDRNLQSCEVKLRLKES